MNCLFDLDLLKDIAERQWHPTPVLLPGKSHGQRSLVGCSPWDRKESDMNERLHFHFLLSCIGEGNGNPLQCSCLENPRDGGAWWAAVYGVAQSRTRLTQLSSSSSSSKDLGLPWWLRNLKIHLQCRRPEFHPWIGKIPWRREQLTTYSNMLLLLSHFSRVRLCVTP